MILLVTFWQHPAVKLQKGDCQKYFPTGDLCIFSFTFHKNCHGQLRIIGNHTLTKECVAVSIDICPQLNPAQPDIHTLKMDCLKSDGYGEGQSQKWRWEVLPWNTYHAQCFKWPRLHFWKKSWSNRFTWRSPIVSHETMGLFPKWGRQLLCIFVSI